MKIKKLILIAFFLICSVIMVPIRAEETPYTVDVVQLENGNIKVSSEFSEVISGFNSLLLKKEGEEVLLLSSDVIKNTEALVFKDPDLEGEFTFLVSFDVGEEKLTLSGELKLSKIVKETSVDSVDKLDGVLKPMSPYIFVNQDDMTLAVWAHTFTGDNETAAVEMYYATSKNGKYKKIKEIDKMLWDDFDDDINDNVIEGTLVFGYGGKVKTGKTYYVKARCSVVVGGTRVYSSWETEKYKATVGRAKAVTVDIFDNDIVKIDWKKASGALRYDIYLFQCEEGFWDIYWEKVREIDAIIDEAIEQYLKNNPWDDDLDFFDWDAYDYLWDALDDFYDENTTEEEVYIKKQTSSTIFKLKEIDINEPFEVSIYAIGKKWDSEGLGAYVDVDPMIYDTANAVKNISITADEEGTEVVFTFNSDLELEEDKCNLWRRYIEWLNPGKSSDKGRKPTQTLKQMGRENKGGLQKGLKKVGKNSMDEDDPFSDKWKGLDFKLFVSTKPNGIYKLANTKARFDSPDLTLTYKAKTGEKLYYKIIPTCDSIGYDYVVRGTNNTDNNFSMSSSKTTRYDEFTLIPGTPKNLKGFCMDYNKVQISVDKGVAINGYELYNADSDKLIKRQKGNIFTVAAPFETTVNYKIRSFRMVGKKRIYSEFTDPAVAVTTEMKAPILTGAKVANTINQVKLSWSQVNGATSYEVWQDGVLIKTLPAKTRTLTIKDLSAGNYQFVVKAVRGSSKRDSNIVSITLP